MIRYLLAVLVIAICIAPAAAGVNPSGPDLRAATVKCARLGYTGHPELMGACVRAMRADYCGDGAAHAVTGTLINLYDRQGIQRDKADWQPEAEWTARGASCVSSVAVMRRGPVPLACAVPIWPSCGMAQALAADTAVVTERGVR
jgi:hypothetical protein